MGVNADDPEDLRGQVEDLRSRLEEAEETLRAIRRGEVDAVVVHEPGGDRVYTFQGADQVYRLLIEQINEGAATLSLGQLGLLVDVDDLELAAAGEVAVAELGQVVDRPPGPRAHPRDEQGEDEDVVSPRGLGVERPRRIGRQGLVLGGMIRIQGLLRWNRPAGSRGRSGLVPSSRDRR